MRKDGRPLRFDVVGGHTVFAWARSLREALAFGAARAIATERPHLVCVADRRVALLKPGAPAEVLVELGRPSSTVERPDRGPTRWPSRHPVTSDVLLDFVSSGAVPAAEFIFTSEPGDVLRGVWDGASWTWDLDALVAEDDERHRA